MLSIEDKQRLEQEAKEGQIANLKQGNERPVSEHDADTGLSREESSKLSTLAPSVATQWAVRSMRRRAAYSVVPIRRPRP